MNPELYWAAGVFDAEGYVQFYTTKKGSRCLRARVVTTDLHMVERFHRAVVGGRIYAVNNGPQATKQRYDWMVEGRTVVETLAPLVDLLSPLRRNQMLTAVFAWEHAPVRPTGRPRKQA
jgi:hypothetical protein